MEPNLLSWHLPSSSGRNAVVGRFVDRYGDVISAEIEVYGLSLNRLTPDATAELSLDFSLKLPQIIVLASRILWIIDNIGGCFADKAAASMELTQGTDNDQTFCIAIGLRDDLVSGPGKLACTIKYNGSSLHDFEACYIIDHSCVEIFRDELRDAYVAISKAIRPQSATSGDLTA